EMIGSKFDEHKMREHRKFFRAIEKRVPYKIGDFEVEWMHITHSIIDSSALAIKTDAGTIIHTGDFKIDHTPIDGFPTDLHRLAYHGEQGVLLLLSDSTNSHSAGFTKSEKTVGPTFDSLFARSKGRVIMSTFSSNIHRVSQAIEYGLKYGRKVCVIGRSMEKNLELAMRLGYIKFPKDQFIEAHEVHKYEDKEILIVTTGSQGEAMSALYRMSIHEHRHIKIKEGDQIILSARAIPGNESSVSTIINHLLKAGAKVAYQDFSEIHVSGHAAQEEQKLMLRLIKPKFFLPVHGEYNHALKHSQTAIDCGVLERNIYVMSDGEQIEVTPKYLKKVKTVKTGKVYIDNQLNHKISDDVVIDRQT
ncbi:MAG: ribonuclease J, partial [Deltaproteobacteria bacterium HGW-Deltaproteobacteria-24]